MSGFYVLLGVVAAVIVASGGFAWWYEHRRRRQAIERVLTPLRIGLKAQQLALGMALVPFFAEAVRVAKDFQDSMDRINAESASGNQR